MNSPSAGWTTGSLPNSQALLATLIIPVTGTWLISCSIAISSVALSTGQLILTNAAFNNIGLTNTPKQATFGGALNAANALILSGSLVVNGLSGTVNIETAFTGGNGVICLYAYSFIQATRIA